jgi:hypothetical protein
MEIGCPLVNFHRLLKNSESIFWKITDIHEILQLFQEFFPEYPSHQHTYHVYGQNSI